MSDNTVDNSTLKAVAVPALVAAGVVILVAVLVLQSDWAGPPKPGGAGATPGGPAVSGESSDASAEGMSRSSPAEGAPEWKSLGSSGLKIWDAKEGEGNACPPGATVTIHYAGWTTAGTMFDSTYLKGSPATTFPLGNLIKGWQEGIPGMKAGGVRRLLIPSDLGYGARGSPPSIPGGATLIFEIKLIKF